MCHHLPIEKEINPMGLDNIPNRYPCSTQGTAVMVTRKDRAGNDILNEDGSPKEFLDCDATQSADGCPWLTAVTRDLGNADGRAVGMLGAPCWYRGKWGNVLLEKLGIYNAPHISFYGDNDDGTVKSPESCRELSNALTSECKKREGRVVLDGEDYSADIQYAAWWTGWVADECDGSNCWY
jgi:hypothetical protein